MRIPSYLLTTMSKEKIQKGFVPGISGSFELIANLSYLVNQACNKQRSLAIVAITLMDLCNAFG